QAVSAGGGVLPHALPRDACGEVAAIRAGASWRSSAGATLPTAMPTSRPHGSSVRRSDVEAHSACVVARMDVRWLRILLALSPAMPRDETITAVSECSLLARELD